MTNCTDSVQVHQHFFCCRLDMAVDDSRGGQGLIVSEVGLLPQARRALRLHWSCSLWVSHFIEA